MPSNFLTSHSSGPVSMEAGADVAACVSLHCAKVRWSKSSLLVMRTPLPPFPAHLARKADGVARLMVLVPRHMVSQKGLSKIYHRQLQVFRTQPSRLVLICVYTEGGQVSAPFD